MTKTTDVLQKKRLITRSDFDGLVCAVLLKHLKIIDQIKFVHPKDMQDRLIEVNDNDITTNLPYVPGVYLAFDHHASESLRNEIYDNHIIIPTAPSAARVVYEYYGGKNRFGKHIKNDLLIAVDKADSAQFTLKNILQPTGWELLNFIMDARTGLGRFKNFNISNYTLMMNLIDYCLNHTIDEILQLPDVKERSELYFKYQNEAIQQIKRCTTIYNNLAVIDLRDEEIIFPTNRFLIYAIYPKCNISIHVLWGLEKQKTVFATGKSIINRTNDINVGELMLKYGGGGHHGAGTCQIDNKHAPDVLDELISFLSESTDDNKQK